MMANEGMDLGRIAPGMAVSDVDGQPLGPVEAVEHAGIRVLGHRVPPAAIARVGATRRGLAEGLAKEELKQVALLAIPTLGFPHGVKALTWIEDLTDPAS